MANFIMAEYKDNLLGEANSFLEVLEQVSRLAPLDKPVLVIGERGTGKELIANRLHSLRAGRDRSSPQLRGAE
jgi:psp operon transcriptional activator